MWKWKSGRKVEFQIDRERNSREIDIKNRRVKDSFFSLTNESNESDEYTISLGKGPKKVYMK